MSKKGLFEFNSESSFADALREEAIENALKIEPRINKCTEYENGWVFTFPECEKSIGGYDASPIVILKEDLGAVVSMIEFMEIIGPGEELGVYPVGIDE